MNQLVSDGHPLSSKWLHFHLPSIWKNHATKIAAIKMRVDFPKIAIFGFTANMFSCEYEPDAEIFKLFTNFSSYGLKNDRC